MTDVINILIVESDNDKAILEAIIRHIKLPNTTIEPIIEYKICSLDGSIEQPSKLIDNLKNIKTKISRGNVDKVGIIYDLDTSTPQQRIAMINNALQQAYQHTSPLSDINQFIKVQVDDEQVQIACHFINIGGRGEIEDLLKEIKNKESHFADCLIEGWHPCLQSKQQTITNKDLVKFWIDLYKRNDVLTSVQRQQAGKNTQWAKFLELHPDSFDFNKDIPELNQLKAFLQLFRQHQTNSPAATPDDHAH